MTNLTAMLSRRCFSNFRKMFSTATQSIVGDDLD
ncbi:hypothetical protein T02_12153 [Trichinella nativa]|uniref:Uncharacterized protein n=1 Tax=Trichinella nativa TaxID=6335 RepID=A0A0V1KJJ4_9BILA|nr:hypothetical protein T02_12153 [Trichinella nativa]